MEISKLIYQQQQQQQQHNSIGCYLSKCNVKCVPIQIKTASCKTFAMFDVREKHYSYSNLPAFSVNKNSSLHTKFSYCVQN